MSSDYYKCSINQAVLEAFLNEMKTELQKELEIKSIEYNYMFAFDRPTDYKKKYQWEITE